MINRRQIFQPDFEIAMQAGFVIINKRQLKLMHSSCLKSWSLQLSSISLLYGMG
jgi:hypothetical protein